MLSFSTLGLPAVATQSGKDMFAGATAAAPSSGFLKAEMDTRLAGAPSWTEPCFLTSPHTHEALLPLKALLGSFPNHQVAII